MQVVVDIKVLDHDGVVVCGSFRGDAIVAVEDGMQNIDRTEIAAMDLAEQAMESLRRQLAALRDLAAG